MTTKADHKSALASVEVEVNKLPDATRGHVHEVANAIGVLIKSLTAKNAVLAIQLAFSRIAKR